MIERLIIVGAGQATAQALSTLRELKFPGSIKIFGSEPILPYQRPPLSKSFLQKLNEPSRLALKPAEFYRASGVELCLGTTVTRLAPCRREVELCDGSRISYDKLLLATGSSAQTIPYVSSDLRGIHYLRTAADSIALGRALQSTERLVVIGGGFIGLEVAAVARKMELDVTVVEAAPRLMARSCGSEISSFFERLHLAHGVKIRLGSRVKSVLATNSQVTAVKLDDGVELAADRILVAVGAAPNVALAEQANLLVDNGIVVDELTRTSDRKIFAAGDCTCHPNAFYAQRIRLESVQNAIDQGKVAANAIAGHSTPYRAIPWFWSNQYEYQFQAAGLISGCDECSVARRADSFVALHRNRGRLLAVEAVNAPAEFMAVRRALDSDLKMHFGGAIH